MATQKINMRQEQAYETRKKLLESARKLFAENGYAGTQVRTINRSIDMADGLIYHYFPGGKKELLQVLIQENFQQIITEVKSRNEQIGNLPIAEVLEQIYRNADEVFTEYLDVFKIFFRENEVRELIEVDQLMMFIDGRRKWFPEFLRERANAGEIRVMDYESAAVTLSAIMMNHFLVKITGLGAGCLSDQEHRFKLIDYQVKLWKP
ncbi:MAG: TetR/AcrR family transcriptional regulator [Clostridiales Family XIII bacterium]|jgi:AcrR family transcriptional regulator|nr:TetR/AcrR family transcriptional regulator [Clostridiales Family XIII bacterium]